MSKTSNIVHKTLNDLSKETRNSVIEVLNARLADAIDLYSQVKQAHWNVKGMNFIAVHELFDEIAAEINSFTDEIAERSVQLGGVALGTSRSVAARSSLKEYPSKIFRSEDHLKALAAVLADFGKKVRAAISETDDAGDADTADLFTGVSKTIDKNLWFIESHLIK